MAKLGPQEQGGYDPFNAISDSLADLATDPEPETEQRWTPPKAPDKPKAAKPKQAATPPPVPAAEAPAATAAVADPPPQSQVRSSRAVPVQTPVAVPVEQAAPKTVSSTSALQTTKRFKTTKQEGLQLDAAAVQLGAALGVSVDFSKVTRALWDVYLRHQEDILRNVPEGELWERPANNDAAGLAELDQRLADLINEGLMVACRRPQNSR